MIPAGVAPDLDAGYRPCSKREPGCAGLPGEAGTELDAAEARAGHARTGRGDESNRTSPRRDPVLGSFLATASLAATPAGYEQLARWLADFGELLLVRGALLDQLDDVELADRAPRGAAQCR